MPAPVQPPSVEVVMREEEQQTVADLTRQIARLTASELQLRMLLRQTHAQLSERDARIWELSAGRRPWERELAHLYEDRERVERERDAAREQIGWMRATRVWRLGIAWWHVRRLIDEH